MRLIITCIVLFLSLAVVAQDGKFQLGAASTAIGGASVTTADPWAIFNNVGAIGRVEETVAAAGYQNKSDIPGFQVMGATVLHHFNVATAGVSYFRFGDDLYNQQKMTLAIGNKIQMVSLGIGVNLLQYTIESLGVKRKVAIEFGGVAEIIPQLSFGAHIFNFSESELVPTVMKAGMSYKPSDQVMINVETQKEIGFREMFKAGVQYRVIPQVFVRTGIFTHPFKSAFGLGLFLKKINFDYCFSSESNLGATHELSLAYKIKRK